MTVRPTHFVVLLLMVVAVTVSTADAGLDGNPTALDQRRIDALAVLDGDLQLGPENPNYPTPNLALKQDWRPEHDFLKKVLAVFARVDAGTTPANRKAEANALLRFAFAKWPAANRGALVGQYAAAWPHAGKMLALRVYMIYRIWLDADIRAEFERRFNLMVGGPQTSSSENIKFNNNQGIFLSHEISGRTGEATFQEVKTFLVNHLRKIGRDGCAEWGVTYNQWTIAAVLNLAEFAENAQVARLAQMNVDYWLARQSGFRVKGRYCSPAVRRYDHWLLDSYAPQSSAIRVLFTGNEFNGNWVEWAVSNYRPLRNVHDLNVRTNEQESRIGEDKYEYRCFRRGDYAIATSQNLLDNYYGNPETHNIVAVLVASSLDPNARW